MNIKDNHISVSSSPYINEVCQELFRRTEIKYFHFARVYDDNSATVLITNPEWHKHFFAKEFHLKYPKSHINAGIYFWHETVMPSQAIVDSRNYFNIDHKFELTGRHEDYYEILGFGTYARNDRIIEFYLNNIDFLKQFGECFKHQANDLIVENAKLCNRLKFTGLERTQEANINPLRDFFKLKKRFIVTLDNNQQNYLTKREVDCLKEIFLGKTMQETANSLNLSRRTVEAHINNVKTRLKCNMKYELVSILIKNSFFDIFIRPMQVPPSF